MLYILYRGGFRYLLTGKHGSSGPGLRTWKVASVALLFAWTSARCASVKVVCHSTMLPIYGTHNICSATAQAVPAKAQAGMHTTADTKQRLDTSSLYQYCLLRAKSAHALID